MNDVQHFEAARKLAERMIVCGRSGCWKLREGCRLVRAPHPRNNRVLCGPAGVACVAFAEQFVVDVSGKGQAAGTRALLLSGAIGGLLSALPPRDFLAGAQLRFQRGGPVPARLRLPGDEAERGVRRRSLREGRRGGAGMQAVFHFIERLLPESRASRRLRVRGGSAGWRWGSRIVAWLAITFAARMAMWGAIFGGGVALFFQESTSSLLRQKPPPSK